MVQPNDNKDRKRGRRPPIDELTGKRPQGGVDYQGRGRGKPGVWLDNRGRVIATAKSEDSGFIPRGRRGSPTRNRTMSLSSVAKARLRRRYGG